ncbi:MAG: HEPN domain-containing protein [Patescibacteria group bacterium]
MTIDTKKLFDYWRRESGYSWDVAKSLYQNKKYPECLFFCHLALEKILKGVVVAKTNKHAPYIHNLSRLLKLSKIPYTKKQYEILSDMNNFHLAGRYEMTKIDFRKQTTLSITAKYLNITKKFLLWLKKEAKKIMSQNQ